MYNIVHLFKYLLLWIVKAQRKKKTERNVFNRKDYFQRVFHFQPCDLSRLKDVDWPQIKSPLFSFREPEGKSQVNLIVLGLNGHGLCWFLVFFRYFVVVTSLTGSLPLPVTKDSLLFVSSTRSTNGIEWLTSCKRPTPRISLLGPSRTFRGTHLLCFDPQISPVTPIVTVPLYGLSQICLSLSGDM